VRAALRLILLALPLLFSCGKAREQAPPVNFKSSSVWQKTCWDRCSAELQKYLNPSVRAAEMRTLDAAYMALLTADHPSEGSYSVPFTTDGVPCEARIERETDAAAITIIRKGDVIGVFKKESAVYKGESTGIKINMDPFSLDSEELHANIEFSSRGAVLVRLEAEGPMELIDVNLTLPEGISISGSFEARRLWELLKLIADEDTESGVAPLARDASDAIHVGVFYEGDLSAPRAKVSVAPLHYLNRFDDYWTWNIVVVTDEGDILNDVWKAIGSVDNATATFIQSWRRLMPHILS